MFLFLIFTQMQIILLYLLGWMIGKVKELGVKLFHFLSTVKRKAGQKKKYDLKWKFPKVARERGKLQKNFKKDRLGLLHPVRESALLVKPGDLTQQRNATHSHRLSHSCELPSSLWRLPQQGIFKPLWRETGFRENWNETTLYNS